MKSWLMLIAAGAVLLVAIGALHGCGNMPQPAQYTGYAVAESEGSYTRSPSLRELCLELVAGSAERFLDLQRSDGAFATEPESDTDEPDFYDQQYILAAALLYVTGHPANPWQGIVPFQLMAPLTFKLLSPY